MNNYESNKMPNNYKIMVAIQDNLFINYLLQAPDTLSDIRA